MRSATDTTDDKNNNASMGPIPDRGVSTANFVQEAS